MATGKNQNAVENVVVDANTTIDSNILTPEQENLVRELMSEAGEIAPTMLDQPIIEGEILTFKIGENQTIRDISKTQKATDTVSAFRFIVSTNGKRVTQSQLVRRRNNGFEIDGDTPNEKWENVLRTLVSGKSISTMVKSIAIQKSTNPKFNDSRIITWSMAV